MTVHFQPLVSPEACPALVLNADFRPLSYYPLSLWSWQDAIKAVFLDRVNIVSNYDRFVRSPTFEMQLPSVVSLKTYIKPSRHPAFTRFNVFLRDRFTCQYCGAREDLTFDHVLPRSKGGTTTWENVRRGLLSVQSAKRRQALPRRRHAPCHVAISAFHQRPALRRPRISAQLPPRELDGLPLLGTPSSSRSAGFRAAGRVCRDAIRGACRDRAGARGRSRVPRHRPCRAEA